MKMRCIICGKAAEIESFCSSCWIKEKKLFEIRDFKITICECGSAIFCGKWEKFKNMEELVESEIKKRILSLGKINKIKISYKFSGNLVKAWILCSGLIKPSKIIKEQEEEINITLRKAKCDVCQKECASYYEAIIQLRAPEIIEKVIKMAGESAFSVREVRGGYDIFIRSNDKAKNLCSTLQKRGFSVVRSVVYLARKNNKNIYRNYYSVKVDENG